MRQLRRLLPYLGRVRTAYTWGILIVVLGAAAQTVSPLLVKAAVEALEQGARREFIFLVAGAVALAAVFRGLLIFGGRALLVTASRRIETDLRLDLFRHLERLPASWFDRHRSGDITSRIINDLEGVRMLAGVGVTTIANTGLTFLFSMIGMFVIDPLLAALALVPLAMVTIVTAASGPPLHRRSLAVQDQLSAISAQAQENFSGIRVVKAFVQEDREIEAFRRQGDEYRRRNLALARYRGMAWALMTLFMEGAILVTLWQGGLRIIGGSFGKADLAAFTAYQFLLVWPMIAIGWVFSLAQRGAACMGRLTELLDERPAPGPDGPADGAPFAGQIEARNLTFAYGDGRAPALKDVSFLIKPGWRVGIVGRTGSGKSSLGALLTRTYEPPPGALFLDGRDVTEIPTERLRRHIGAVPQDLFLFSDTLRNNIAFGAVADPEPAAVEAAARLSRIGEDAARFPAGLDQLIGERGVTLSGGQKQRTALARAAIREPAILVLDDALSSVDSGTEREILEGLRAYARGRTTLLITHRMGPVLECDHVLVLDEGRVAESGPPGDLLRRGGLFARMVERQRLADELGAEVEGAS